MLILAVFPVFGVKKGRFLGLQGRVGGRFVRAKKGRKKKIFTCRFKKISRLY
jgi:hypothetical protein